MHLESSAAAAAARRSYLRKSDHLMPVWLVGRSSDPTSAHQLNRSDVAYPRSREELIHEARCKRMPLRVQRGEPCRSHHSRRHDDHHAYLGLRHDLRSDHHDSGRSASGHHDGHSCGRRIDHGSHHRRLHVGRRLYRNQDPTKRQ